MNKTRLNQANAHSSEKHKSKSNALETLNAETTITSIENNGQVKSEQANDKITKTTKQKKTKLVLAESKSASGEVEKMKKNKLLDRAASGSEITAPKSTSNGSASEQKIHIICKHEILNAALAFVKNAVSTKPLQPILGNILVSADKQNQKLKFTASDIKLTFSVTFAAQVLQDGAIAVPAEILANVIDKCPPGQITLSTRANVSPDSRKSKLKSQSAEEANFSPILLLVDSQGGTVEIYGMDAKEFPENSIPLSNLISLPVKAVKTGLKAVVFAASTDDSNPVITGVQWVYSTEKQTLRCIATDGHQIAIGSLSIGEKERMLDKSKLPDYTCLISAKALKELIRNLDKLEGDESLFFANDASSKRVLFNFSDRNFHKEIVSQCIEAAYPDCQNLINRYRFTKEILVEKTDLLTKLARLTALTSKKENEVKLLFDSNAQTIHLMVERDYGKGTQTVSAVIPEDIGKFEIRFNISYLINALKALSSTSVNFTMDRPYTPVSLKPAGDLEFPELAMDATYFILPLYDLEKANQAKQEYNSESNSG